MVGDRSCLLLESLAEPSLDQSSYGSDWSVAVMNEIQLEIRWLMVAIPSGTAKGRSPSA